MRFRWRGIVKGWPDSRYQSRRCVFRSVSRRGGALTAAKARLQNDQPATTVAVPRRNDCASKIAILSSSYSHQHTTSLTSPPASPTKPTRRATRPNPTEPRTHRSTHRDPLGGNLADTTPAIAAVLCVLLKAMIQLRSWPRLLRLTAPALQQCLNSPPGDGL